MVNPAKTRLPCCRLECGLRMYVAATCAQKLLGVWGLPERGANSVLCLLDCRAIHTLGLRRPMDIVFLDAGGRELRRIDSLAPNRCAWSARASCVIELPPTYCSRHPDYFRRIGQGLLKLVPAYRSRCRTR